MHTRTHAQSPRRRPHLWHVDDELRVDDGHARREEVVGDRVLHARLLIRDHRKRRHLGACATRRGDAHHGRLAPALRQLVHALADVHEAHRQALELGLRHLVHEPHDLGGVHGRAAAERNDHRGVGRDVVEDLVRDIDLVKHARDLVAVAEVKQRFVGYDEGALLAAQVAQRHLQAARLEVHLGRHAEPQHVLAPLGHRLDVEQLHGANIGGHRGGAPRPAPERQRRVQVEVVQVADRALRRRRVDEHAHGVDGAGKMVDVRLVERVGVEHRGVACTGKAHELVCRVHTRLKRRCLVEREHRAQLLLGQRLVVADTLHLTDDDLGTWRRADAEDLGQVGDGLADNVCIEPAVNDDLGANLVLLGIGQEVGAALLELGLNLVVHIGLHAAAATGGGEIGGKVGGVGEGEGAVAWVGRVRLEVRWAWAGRGTEGEWSGLVQRGGSLLARPGRASSQQVKQSSREASVQSALRGIASLVVTCAICLLG
eukprot:355269-Chlamydomonas_euryale.AAC.2